MPSPAIAAPVSPVAAAAPVASGANAATGAAAASGAAPGGTDALAALQGSGTIGADFAALLLAQIGAGTTTEAAPPLAASKTNDAAAEDKSDDPMDMSALFAALTMAQPAVPAAAATTAKAGEKSEAIGDILQAGGKGNGALQADGTTGKADPAVTLPAADAAGDKGEEGAQQDGKAAKFADFDSTLKQAAGKSEVAAPNLPDAPPAVHAAHQGHGAPNPVNTVQPRVETPVRDPGFAQEFGQKIVWLAGQDKQTAQLTLNPPQLGPVEVSLKISGDQATAVFASPHAEVREAIEAALPRLREMMGSAGLELGQANVSSQSFQQQQEQAQQQQAAASSRGGNAGGILGNSGNEAPAAVSSGTVVRHGNGLVDTFA